MPTTKPRKLPQNVYAKAGRYYHVHADGKKRIWKGLSRISDGLPALYEALAAMERSRTAGDMMPQLIADWQRDVMARHASKTQTDEIRRCSIIAEAFAAFRARDVQAPDAAEFLQVFSDRTRTHNLYRAQLRELMRYAIERGHRTDNPIVHLRTLSERPRTRYITDSELRRIKVAAITDNDGSEVRNGRMFAALIDLAYLTGQDLSMLLALRWSRDPSSPDTPHISDDGLWFRRAKTIRSTGAAVTIQWTPALRAVVERLRAMRAARLLRKRADQRIVCERLITTQSGHPMTLSAAESAWRRAMARATATGKVAPAKFRDIRAKALTDTEKRHGMAAARDKGQHSTDSQTDAYIRRKTARKAPATR